jgi:hypothetical protein
VLLRYHGTASSWCSTEELIAAKANGIITDWSDSIFAEHLPLITTGLKNSKEKFFAAEVAIPKLLSETIRSVGPGLHFPVNTWDALS